MPPAPVESVPESPRQAQIGRRWPLVWLLPAAARVAATVLYSQWASVRSAQSHLDEADAVVLARR